MKKLLIVSILLLVSSVCASPIGVANELAIGKLAKTSNVIEIPIVPTADLNFKPRAEILAMRQKEVMKYAYLLTSYYSPSDDVFGQIADKLPWCGTQGEAYYGAGMNSIRGLAVQSRYILNPFLLAAVRSTPDLPRQKVTETDLIYKTYPDAFPADGLRWWPKQGKAEVTYQISSLKSQMCSLFGAGNWQFNGKLGLELINARDLGLNYVYIPPTWACNMKLGSPMRGIMKIPQLIRCEESCGFPGGCNNMSPPTPWLDEVTVTSLPARVVLMMWKNQPTTGREPTDMIFTINCR